VFGVRKNINSVAGLQVFNILRFVTFLIISIVFTKIGLSKEEIGLFEVAIFIASIASFFWVTGLVQAFLPLYKSSKTFGDEEKIPGQKSPEIFNIYIILIFFSLAVAGFGFAIQGNFSVFGFKGHVPLLNITLWYLLLSSPANLVEYIYMVQNKSGNTLSYAYITYTLQLIAAILPVVLGYNVIWSLRALVIVAGIRNIWLLTLIYNYAEIKISVPYIKEILVFSAPLIVSSLVSGSSQYIDGLVISTHYNADGFAIFRYGAKELPFVAMLAAGLSSAMLTEFNDKSKIHETLAQIKKKSLRIMHMMFPLTIVLLLFAKPMFKAIFSPEFTRSSDDFVIYLLANLSRLLFPHTILIGLKKGKSLMTISFIEVLLNIFFSIWLVNIYGIVGVALATVVAYLFSKAIMIAYNYYKLGINPSDYIPIRWYAFYSFMLGLVFVLLDRKIIVI
jgi:O-antigen/teichoic acid export membrane protein